MSDFSEVREIVVVSYEFNKLNFAIQRFSKIMMAEEEYVLIG